MEVSTWFILVFTLMWAAAPLTQFLQLVAPKLHMKLGLTEAHAFDPEFKWFLLDQKATAVADMTLLVSGVLFVWLALLGDETALIFGLYTSACYVYSASTYIPKMLLLARHALSPAPKKQLGAYLIYMSLFLAFGLYGLFYLWGLAQQ